MATRLRKKGTPRKAQYHRKKVPPTQREAPLKMWRPQGFKDHPMPRPNFPRRGICDNVVDGDTFDAMTEMGVTNYEYYRVRLQDIDCPEIFSPKTALEKELGLKAKTFVESVMLGNPVKLTFKSDDQVQGRFICKTAYYVGKVEMDLGAELTKRRLLKSDVPAYTAATQADRDAWGQLPALRKKKRKVA